MEILTPEVSDLMAKMKFKIDDPSVIVRRRINNASLATKVKYKRAVWSMAIGHLTKSLG